jgi:hypothetical protein
VITPPAKRFGTNGTRRGGAYPYFIFKKIAMTGKSLKRRKKLSPVSDY